MTLRVPREEKKREREKERESLEETDDELLSRIMDVASPSRSALPLPKVTLEHEADLLVSSLSAPPSVRVLDFDGLPLVT